LLEYRLLHIQEIFSKLRTLSAITDKLQNRYFDFWHKLLFNDNRVIGGNNLRTYRKIKTDKLLSFTFNICSQYSTLDLSAFRESGYNPSSPKIAILVSA
jgi:hypothetical protein